MAAGLSPGQSRGLCTGWPRTSSVKKKVNKKTPQKKMITKLWTGSHKKGHFIFLVFNFRLPWTPETKFQFDAPPTRLSPLSVCSISVDYCSRCGLGSPGKLERTWKPEPGVSPQQIPTFPQAEWDLHSNASLFDLCHSKYCFSSILLP